MSVRAGTVEGTYQGDTPPVDLRDPDDVLRAESEDFRHGLFDTALGQRYRQEHEQLAGIVRLKEHWGQVGGAGLVEVIRLEVVTGDGVPGCPVTRRLHYWTTTGHYIGQTDWEP